MSYSGETADEFMRFTMEGTKVVAQITGAGAKELVALMLAILNDKKETIGKTRLKNMLRSGKELKVFTIRENDLKTFQKNAKRYGISYTALVNRKSKNKDGIVDILVKAEDAQRIDRIVERFSLMIDESAKVRTDVRKARDEKLRNEQKEYQNNIDLSKENDNDKAKPVLKEGQSVPETIKKEMLTIREQRKLSQLKGIEKNENFSEAKTERGRLLEPKLETSKNAAQIKGEAEYRPSVRKTMMQLRYKLENEQKIAREKEKTKYKNKNPKHLEKGKSADKDTGKHIRPNSKSKRAKIKEKVR